MGGLLAWYCTTSAKTALLSASGARAMASVQVRPTISVPVPAWIFASAAGARPSPASMIASRDGASIVELSDVQRAITAPPFANQAAASCRYTPATAWANDSSPA